MNCRVVLRDGTSYDIAPALKKDSDRTVIYLRKDEIPAECDHVDFLYDTHRAKSCGGFMFAPRGTAEGGTVLCTFRERNEDTEYVSDSNYMPVFGFSTEEKCIFAVVDGMKYHYRIVMGVKGGEYYIYPRFFLDGKCCYEDISISLYDFPVGSDYNDMASLYRNLKNPRPLKEKVAEYPAVRYALEAPELRVRLAWKPVPTPVMCQTEENEPAVTVGCTLARLKDIIDGLKSHGIEKCEICLVGVEKSGHDGRWPQLLPIEESIGGEDALREVCAYGQSLGYQMVVHTNSTEMYEISKYWNKDDVIIDREGEYSFDPISWGGGRPYHICPKRGAEHAKDHFRILHEMGFRGLHYVDVITNFSPRACFNPLHPLTCEETADIYRRIGEMAREKFGGFQSEGGFDFAADILDFSLYTCYNLYTNLHPLFDETIPFWQLVYHGSILYNPSTETVNFCVKDEKAHLKFIEYGGRPAMYFNSKYVDEGGCGNWMGETDLLCATDEMLESSLQKFKAVYDEYVTLNHLQYEKMIRHEKLSDGIYRTTYSDGTSITVDYNSEKYEVSK